VDFGDHQKMNRRPWVYVVEDKNLIILVDHFRRDFSRHNFAKQAIWVGVSQMIVDLRGQTKAHGFSASRAKTLRKAFSSIPLVAASTILFYTGAAFCYFFVFGQAFPAIQKMAPISVAVSPDIEAYLDFVITMFIAFGVAFEVPIVVVILARMGIVTVAQLKSFRTYFIVGAAAVSALVTPPDPVSMIALLVPMYLLYEIGIISAQVFIKHTQAPEVTPETPEAKV